MSVKLLQIYTHQQELSRATIRKQTQSRPAVQNPRPKQTPKPKPVKPPPQVYYSDE